MAEDYKRGVSQKKMKNANKTRKIALVCCLVLLLSALIGGGYAKYVQEKGKPGTPAEFSVKLAEAFAAQESKSAMPTDDQGVITNDGTYLLESESVEGNNYWLIPGTKLAKNPSLTITTKTEIPAYLYAVIERTVVENDHLDSEGNSEGAWYAVNSNWKFVKETSGDNDTVISVYVYTGGETEAKLINSSNAPTGEIEILKNNGLYNKYLEQASSTDDQTFTIWGVLVQKTDDDLNAKRAFEQLGTEVLKDSTVQLVNTLSPAIVSANIDEDFNGKEKKDVNVVNEGDIPVLIRAKIVVNWVEEASDGKYNVVANAVGHKAVITPENPTGWTLIDGYYYYNGIVAPGEETDYPLISSAKVASDSATEYQLQIDIVTEAIQATGYKTLVDENGNDAQVTPAVQDAWGHSFNSDTSTWTE